MTKQPKPLPFRLAPDFLVVKPATPSTKSGGIALPQQSVEPTSFGLVVEVGENCSIVPGNVALYSRSFPMPPVMTAMDDGTWRNDGYLLVDKHALRCHWTVDQKTAEALLNPEAQVADPAAERELRRVREAKV